MARPDPGSHSKTATLGAVVLRKQAPPEITGEAPTEIQGDGDWPGGTTVGRARQLRQQNLPSTLKSARPRSDSEGITIMTQVRYECPTLGSVLWL